MRRLRYVAVAVACGLVVSGGRGAFAQEMPSEYKTVLTTLGKTGDFREGVLKVNVPRNDLRVTIGQRPAPRHSGSADGLRSRRAMAATT